MRKKSDHPLTPALSRGERGQERGRANDALAAHVAECAECEAAAPDLGRVRAVLDAGGVPVDSRALSQHAMARLAPEMARRAAVAFRRRVAWGLLVSLLPLPLVLAFDAYVLSIVYGLAAALLPDGLAAYMVLSYAAALFLLFGATYAAIPVLIARQTAPRSTPAPA